jgi:aryl-alcohol dehydrogenase-like predicted oxidoreductase
MNLRSPASIHSVSRRDFLRGSTAALGVMGLGACAGSGSGAADQGRSTGTAAGSGASQTGGADWQGRRRLGRTDLLVGAVGFGGAEIGFANADQASVDRLLNLALDQGLESIDTAECYRESEVLIGNAIGHRRADYLLFTKVGHWPEDGWTATGVQQSIERSLVRLKTDYLDLVHLHSCGLDVLERGEVITALEAARTAGKVRYIGYSGDSAAADFAVRTGRFDTLMTSINFADQEAIDLTLPECRARGMGVIIKRALANAVWRYDALPDNGYHQEYWRRMQVLDFDFTRPERRDQTGPDGPAGIALRFVLGLPGVHTAVIGTTNPDRFAENRALLAGGPLEESQVKALRERWAQVAPPEWIGQI